MADLLVAGALMLDAAIGWPDRLYQRVGHPVGAFARLIAAGERWGNRPDRSDAERRTMGIVLVVVLVACGAGSGWAADMMLREAFGSWWWVAGVAVAWPGIAARSLHDHVRPVADALASGDITQARTAVAKIVGRDVAGLEPPGVARAAIESLAESVCDGVVAPVFWLAVAGLPGLWAYKAINTADSLIGHREERWRAFGWAAARLDDVANLVPARLSGLLLCVAGRGGWRVMMRDHGRHASPNAGWPEAAMAGVLGVALAGPVTYDGQAHEKPWIFAEGRGATAEDVRAALRVCGRAWILLVMVAGAIAWLR